jgi:hypothetical protein
MLGAPEHFLDVVELALAVGVRVEDTVIHNPEALRFGVHVDAGDHPYTKNHSLRVAAPLLTHSLDLRAEALVEHCVVEDQVRLGNEPQHWPNLLP